MRERTRDPVLWAKKSELVLNTKQNTSLNTSLSSVIDQKFVLLGRYDKRRDLFRVWFGLWLLSCPSPPASVRCDICEGCRDNCCNHKLSGGVDHHNHHQLTNRPSKMTHRYAVNEEALKLRFSKLWIFRDRTVHASRCRSRQCQHPDCSKLKGFFRHGIQCQVRASGGCVVCQRMWYIIHVHARVCKESVCPVPRCRELKAHHRSVLQLKDSRRRAAVMKRMRKRVAELSLVEKQTEFINHQSDSK